MKILKKINDKEVLVDDEIYDHVKKYNWILNGGRVKRYRQTNDPINAPALINLRDVVWNFFHPDILCLKQIYHINGNKLDCRIENLFGDDNKLFPMKNKGNNALPKGIHFHHKKFCVTINNEYGGRFLKLQDAVDKYREMELRIYGSLARSEEDWLESLKPYQHLLDK